MQIPKGLTQHMDRYSAMLSGKLKTLYENCFLSTIKTALKKQPDDSYFVLTGDIPAMWLRDSAAEVNNYISCTENDEEVRNILKGVIKRQLSYICIDPYANAFNEVRNGRHGMEDIPVPDDWVWERKYELDSLCYPLRLIYLYYKASGDSSILDDRFLSVMNMILKVFKTEQDHFADSDYYFVRKNCPDSDKLPFDGRGTEVIRTGMIWSGFRPSDDACRYGYFIPSNMFAVTVLGYAAELLKLMGDEALAWECIVLAREVKRGIEEYGTIIHEKYGRIYVCETDGMGNYSLFDDANIPSLLSIPYIGYLPADNELYQNTRRFVLSEDNPYYYSGKCASGIGSPHTPEGYIWHMALCMQALTSRDNDEIKSILDMLESTDADTGHMHEGFDKDDPNRFTRPWFCWADSLFAETVEFAVDCGAI